MDAHDWLAERFEAQRTHLRGVAYRLLGSPSEADDAVQEAWLRLSRADASGIANLGGWLTTVVARICLDMLRSRASRREEPLGTHVNETIISREDRSDPEHETLMADAIGLALLVVLDTLNPAERLAFVLHDLFDMPFDEIAPIVGRNAAATRQLASRARRRVRGPARAPGGDSPRQRAVVTAFLAASRAGDFDGLLALLAPDAVFRADGDTVAMGAAAEVRGATAVAKTFSGRAQVAKLALVKGVPGAVWAPGGHVRVVFMFTVTHGQIVAIELVADPARLAEFDPVILDE